MTAAITGAEGSDLSAAEAEYLRTLRSAWQMLADLSFSDLLLYVKVGGEEAFEITAQVRPFTSQTLYPQDMVGTVLTQPEQPIVERAFREGQIWTQEDPVLVDGMPIRMDAVPVLFEGKVIAVITKEGSPAAWRRPGRLEEVYLEAADHISRMICDGRFLWSERPEGDWPRVGDGLFRLDPDGRVVWASPNALSALRRLGVAHNVLGSFLDELGLGRTPVHNALHSMHLMDGELVKDEAHIFLRVVPLSHDGVVVGGLVLARDVTELRQKERVISVKDATNREIHHRVKNNLQTIASLLRLQSRRLHSDEAKAALQESVWRIGSIALVHETLSESPSDVAEFGEVARRIGHMISDGLVWPERHVDIKITGSTGALAAEVATPLAVTLTELLQNAIEHGFPDGRSGVVAVEIAREYDDIVMVVRDDGVGMAEDAKPGSRLGLQIVRSLVDELGGSFEITSDAGTTVHIRVPHRLERD